MKNRLKAKKKKKAERETIANKNAIQAQINQKTQKQRKIKNLKITRAKKEPKKLYINNKTREKFFHQSKKPLDARRNDKDLKKKVQNINHCKSSHYKFSGCLYLTNFYRSNYVDFILH